MIEAGQLRRWRGRDDATGLFLVVRHEPVVLTEDITDDGWLILPTGRESEWHFTDDLELSTDLVQG